MSSDTWILSNDLCRCCHAEGCFKILNVPCCNEDGETEVYSEMLREQLGVDIQQVDGIFSETTYKICEKCIERLKDVVLFKKQVITCENKFKDLLAKGRFQAVKLEILNNEVKTEDDENEGYIGATDLHDSDSDDASFQMKFSDEDSIDKDTEDEPETKKRKGKSKVKARAKTKSLKKEKPKKESTQRSGTTKVDEYIIETSDERKKYKCAACKTSYARIADLRNHILRQHLNIKSIQCTQCNEKFSYHSQRINHMYEKHDQQKPEMFICDYCGRKFRRKNTLYMHMLDVHIEKKCSNCDLKFCRNKYLFHQNEVHGKPMPTCGICGLRKLSMSSLIRHQRNVHLCEKDFVCTVCGKRFYRKYNLAEHMITHSKDRIYKCDVCSKSFSRKECFNSHYRIHTGEKRFVCRVCDAAFVHRGSLRFHLRCHHGDLGGKK